ncbi:hypothetical protein ACM0BF_14310 [Mycobacteroides abscessus subsp. abscessus]|uniref:hypothetical protein n=1 Tax=Mycobacteroides abscessus TaxID=36809 RepID=UPI0039EE6105
MNITQSRPCTKVLVSLVVAAITVGCSTSTTGHPTAVASSSGTGTISTTGELVDVSAVWATHPLPPCADYLGANLPTPPGLELPDQDSVAEELRGVQSPATVGWVKTKLGWVTKALSETRAGIIDANTPGDTTELRGFKRYVGHVETELQAGHDITDSDADGDFPEGC